MSITLYLMGEKGYYVLKELMKSNFASEIAMVVQAHDIHVQNDYYEEIKNLCKDNDIERHDRKEDITLNSDYYLAISWRWLIPIKDGKLIILHDSLLPKYRGFAPLVNMLINREPHIGVTAIFASNEFDKGDIICQEGIHIDYPIKIQSAIELLTPIYAKIVKFIISEIIKDRSIEGLPQNETEASYSLWRDEEDYRIDWNQSAESIQQFVYSVGYPYLGASTIYNGKLIRIYDCESVQDVTIVNRTAGKVLFIDNGCPIIVCGKGLLKLKDVRDNNGNYLLPLKQFRIRLK